MSATYTLRLYCVLAIFEAGRTARKSFPITLVTNVPKFAVSCPFYLKHLVPYQIGNKCVQICCNLYARAVIVTLGLGRPLAGRE